MKFLAPIAAVLGLTLLIALVVYFGFSGVAQALLSSRWGTVLVVLVRAIALAAAGAGWWFLLTPQVRRGPYIFAALRFVREAINSLLPFVGVGGDLVGARLLARFGVATNLALASVLIDIFIQVVCLIVFVLVGAAVVLALNLAGTQRLTATTFIMLAVALPAVSGFFLTLNFGAFEPVVRRLIAFGKRHHWARLDHVIDIGKRLQQIWRNPRGLSASFFVHLAAVFFGASEVWIALRFMGRPVSVSAALVIESLGQGSRAAAFMLPGGIGVQDGALVAVCSVFGVPADVALAMALIKRVPDLILGVPALLGWQALEGKRLLSFGN